MSLNENSLLFKYQREKNGKARKKILENGNVEDKSIKLPLYLEALKDPDIDNKALAIKFLGEISDSESLLPLIELTQHRLEIQQDLISTIVTIIKKGDLEEVIPLFKKIDNLNMRKSIPLILGEFSNNTAKTYLIDLLHDKNAIVRKNAIKALEKIVDKEDLDQIILMLNDDDLQVINQTIIVLGHVGVKEEIKTLINFLKHEEELIRKSTVRALYRIIKREGELKLVYNIINKRNPIARREAVKILGLLKKPESIKFLMKLLYSKDGKIRRLASSSILKTLKQDKSLINLIREGINNSNWQVRKYCAKILGELEDEESIELLVSRLNDSKSPVRRSVTNSLSKFNSDMIIEISESYLESEDWRIRRAVVDLLRNIGNASVVKSLVKCLDDTDIYVRSWAINALGKLKDEDSLGIFHKLLNSEDSRIRIAVVKALGKISDKKSINPLIQSLGDDDYEVRREIEKALERIEPEWMNLL
ncbi:MAG: HEAT repeat domain-containing protein [Promethearchaeota archaeon]